MTSLPCPTPAKLGSMLSTPTMTPPSETGPPKSPLHFDGPPGARPEASPNSPASWSDLAYAPKPGILAARIWSCRRSRASWTAHPLATAPPTSVSCHDCIEFIYRSTRARDRLPRSPQICLRESRSIRWALAGVPSVLNLTGGLLGHRLEQPTDRSRLRCRRVGPVAIRRSRFTTESFYGALPSSHAGRAIIGA
jgi:hypothetical protein